MFCYQRNFGLPTEVVTKEQFRALITAPETFRKVKEAREALARGDKNAYDSKKKSLPFVIFIATYDESESAKSKKMGRWRNQKYCRLNGLCVIDFDHIDSLTPSPSIPSEARPPRSLPERRGEYKDRAGDMG